MLSNGRIRVARCPNPMTLVLDRVLCLASLSGGELPQFVQVMAVAAAVILASKMFRS